jgi:hypothetical protein
MKGARSNLAVVPWVFSDAFSTVVSREASPLDRTERIAKKSFARVREATRRPSSNVEYKYPSGRTTVPSRHAPSRSRARERTFLFQPGHHGATTFDRARNLARRSQPRTSGRVPSETNTSRSTRRVYYENSRELTLTVDPSIMN